MSMFSIDVITAPAEAAIHAIPAEMAKATIEAQTKIADRVRTVTRAAAPSLTGALRAGIRVGVDRKVHATDTRGVWIAATPMRVRLYRRKAEAATGFMAAGAHEGEATAVAAHEAAYGAAVAKLNMRVP